MNLLPPSLTDSTPCLLLVDGSSYLYRAFNATGFLKNKNGESTGATHTIIDMLRKLVEQYPHSTHRICVFDAKGETFRHRLSPEYKATRPPMPDDLRTQVAWIHTLVAALGWHLLVIPEVEADDVIGTLAQSATQQGYQTIISTGDKDITQLVNTSVTVVDTLQKRTLDIQGVEDKFGIPPTLMVDYLMLIGDTSDNVAGVKGCGEKTAVKWLKEYGSLNHIINQSHLITGKVGEHLRAFIPQFELTRQLITLKCDVDLSEFIPNWDIKGFNALITPPLNPIVLSEWFNRLGLEKHSAFYLKDNINNTNINTTNININIKNNNNNNDNNQNTISDFITRHTIISTEEGLFILLNALNNASLVALDTETNSLGSFKAELVGISVCYILNNVYDAYYIPVGHTYYNAPTQLTLKIVLDTLKPWLESNAPKVLQHAKFDMHVFANHGIYLKGIAHDTLLQAYTLESHKRNNLGDLAQRYLGRSGISYESLCGKGAKAITINEVDIHQVSEYACEDAIFTLQLHHILYPKILDNNNTNTNILFNNINDINCITHTHQKINHIYDLEIVCQSILFEIERYGVCVDTIQLKQLSHTLGIQLLQLEQQAYQIAKQPFNLKSPKQVAGILYDVLKYPIQHKTATGIPSTDEEALSALAASNTAPLASVLLEHRGCAKLKDTYADALPTLIEPTTGRLHTHYAQAAVITGRLSSSNPNLQNIPVKTEQGRKVRQAFNAPIGHCIVSADYSQIELRIMAHLSQDPTLIQAFQMGVDIHQTTAAEVLGIELKDVTPEQRRHAKAINFGLIYGMGAFGLASQLNISPSEAKTYITRYFERYQGVKAFMDKTKTDAHAHGYVSTLFGRRLWLPDIHATGPRRAGAERAAINAPMQGTAADLIKLAMVAIHTWIKQTDLQSHIVMQVHDELVLQVPDCELKQVLDYIPQAMSNVATLSVPLIANVMVGKNWDEAH